MSVTKIRQAVENFLRANPNDIISFYHSDLETQVQVISTLGDKTDFGGFTQFGDTWHNIRWPKNGKTHPEWKDTQPLTFDLSKYAESIGTSGWNFISRQSEFVAFDIDSKNNHSEGINDDEIDEIISLGKKCSYIDVFRSTSGKGLHFYCRFDPESLPPSENRVEHKNVALYVLDKLKHDLGEKFVSSIDVCGNIFWIWSRRATANSYQRLSTATKLLRFDSFEDNWHDRVDSIVKPYVPDRSSISYIGASPFDATHRSIIAKLQEQPYAFSIDQTERRITTHTKALEIVANQMLDFVGAFTTKSQGTDARQNCFMFPIANGGFTVFRFGNVVEDFPWRLSKNKNYYCPYNCQLDPIEVFTHFGMEYQPKSGSRKERFCSDSLEETQKALRFLGCEFDCAPLNNFVDRSYIQITPGTTNTLRVAVDSSQKDYLKNLGFLESGRNHYVSKALKFSKNVFGEYLDTKKAREDLTQGASQILEISGIEHIARHTKQSAIYGAASDQLGAWWVGTSLPGEGHKFCLVHSDSDVVKVLQSEYPGLSVDDGKAICGDLLRNPWIVTCVPFQDEYAVEKHWNMNAPKFAAAPADLDDCEEAIHPTWDMILSHCGEELDRCLPKQSWYSNWGLHTGKEYLTAWISCVLFEPDKKLPYLFLTGPQHTGKSTFHEAIRLLMIRGDEDGSRALTNSSAFNGELDGKVLTYIEEVDLSRQVKDKNLAYERIKDWTVAPFLSIRHMYRAPYRAKNYLHFIQVANSLSACPIDADDTRVTAIQVQKFPGPPLPNNIRDQKLRDEAPHFMVTLKRAHRRLPPMEGRLRIPVVETDTKREIVALSSDAITAFIKKFCEDKPTGMLAMTKFYNSLIVATPSNVNESTFPLPKVRASLKDMGYTIIGEDEAATIHGLELNKKFNSQFSR